nr:GerMN domain-containing protein [Acidaminobacter sp. JC074]
MYSNEINKIIENDVEADLAAEALIKSLTRLPHIDRLSLFVDDQQLANTFYNVDLSQVYEQATSTQVYLSESNSTSKRYLIPFEISEDNVYDEILSIFNTLKTGYIDNKQWTQIIPPEVEMSTFMIEGTTITADFNSAFLKAYEDKPEYRRLMINAILYSFTSNPNINKVLITVDGQALENYGGYSFLEPQLEPSYINFIGEY